MREGCLKVKSNILIVDDEKEIVFAIAKLLEREGYTTYKAYNGIEALESLAANHINLIIMDVMMPKLDGLSTIIKIREKENIPIIILSAKFDDSDKVLGLDIGADDYIVKPYNPIELLARVNSLLRRFLVLGSNQTQDKDSITVGGLQLNKKSKNITVDGEQIKLTATEYSILALLMEYKGQVFSADAIYSKVWNEEAFAAGNTVMVHIRRIREKIEINPKEPKYLKVVWGIGYKIEG
jgi:DNA-binding response OmpR family regulator